MFKLLATLLIFTQAIAQISISFGPVDVGEKRININLKDFKIIRKNNYRPVNARLQEKSIQWIRTPENLLMPRALLNIEFKNHGEHFISYGGKRIIPTGSENKSVSLYINLLNPGPVEIYRSSKLVDILSIRSLLKTSNKEGHLIDYSCSRYGIDIKGLDDQFLTMGCLIENLGDIGEEKNRLTINWATTNYKLSKNHSSPYTIIATKSSSIDFKLVDDVGKYRRVKISFRLNPRYHRLKTAIGLGPYSFKSYEDTKYRDTTLAPAFMLYSRWDLQKSTSLRAFDAFISNDTIFNNLGLYFAYELASAFDNRLQIVPLLGMQVLSFKYNKNTVSTHKAIYPQGFEINFKHFLGIENYNISYGMFLTTKLSELYDNLWLRWGKGYFWEINYIRWGRASQRATMWGLSIGIPTGQYF